VRRGRRAAKLVAGATVFLLPRSADSTYVTANPMNQSSRAPRWENTLADDEILATSVT
jgi:hypothetical protein